MSTEAELWTIRRLLEWTAAFFVKKGIDPPRLCAEMLLAHVLGTQRIRLYTDFDKVPSAKDLAAFRDLVKRAGEQEPVAYLTGKAPFFSLEIEINRNVLIPRADTETLVEYVVQVARQDTTFPAEARILDLCTGSGCVALAVASRMKNATVVATDVSTEALDVARKNAQRLGLDGRVTFLQGDLYEALSGSVEDRPFDVIISNPPYIPSGMIDGLDKSVKDYEPRLALDGGEDGMNFHRRIAAGAVDRLSAGGRLVMEIQFDQGRAVSELLLGTPALGEVLVIKDFGRRERAVVCRKPL